MMKNAIIALGILLLVGSTSFAGWYVVPTVAYYPGVPVYAYPAPVIAALRRWWLHLWQLSGPGFCTLISLCATY